MKTLKKTLLILVSAFVITAIGCKKDCLSPISPNGSSEPIHNLEFKWDDCGTGPYSLKLYLGENLVLDTSINGVSFIHGQKLLTSDTIYSWVVSNKNGDSEPTSFRTQLTDSFFVGTYRMSKSYHWNAGPNNGNDTLGDEIINIISLGPNYIQVQDSTGAIMFSKRYSSSGTDRIFYGSSFLPNSSAASLSISSGMVGLIERGSQGAGGGSSTSWSGYKIP